VQRTDSCWLWTGALNGDGYGRLYIALVDGEEVDAKAFRLAYEMYVGPVPDGMWLDHVCHSTDPTCPGGKACLHRRCVNPAHLEVVAPGENTRRAHRPGYFLPNTCKRGHDWDKYPPGVALRKNGTISRTCWVCRTERRGKSPDDVIRAPYRRRTTNPLPEPATWQVSA
jgi:hypothetical protein